jgi:hypothetical protein
MGYSHLCWFNFVANPIPTMTSFSSSIWNTRAVLNIPAMMLLSVVLKDIVNLPRQAPIFLIVDALHECPNTSSLSSARDKVLTLMEDLVESRSQNLRICVTSRLEADIKPILEPLTSSSVSLHDERGQKEDIENYIKSVVNTNRRMRRWRAEQRQLVIDVLTARADGM